MPVGWWGLESSLSVLLDEPNYVFTAEDAEVRAEIRRGTRKRLGELRFIGRSVVPLNNPQFSFLCESLL